MEKKYRIRETIWKPISYMSGEGVMDEIGEYDLRVRPRYDNDGYDWCITLRTTVISKNEKQALNLEYAKYACEAAWVAFLEKEFLEVVE